MTHLVEEALKTLVCKIDEELLESVSLENLEAKDIQDTHAVMHLQRHEYCMRHGLLASVHGVSEGQCKIHHSSTTTQRSYFGVVLASHCHVDVLDDP